jgi:hypothetical protein
VLMGKANRFDIYVKSKVTKAAVISAAVAPIAAT